MQGRRLGKEICMEGWGGGLSFLSNQHRLGKIQTTFLNQERQGKSFEHLRAPVKKVSWMLVLLHIRTTGSNGALD